VEYSPEEYSTAVRSPTRLFQTEGMNFAEINRGAGYELISYISPTACSFESFVEDQIRILVEHFKLVYSISPSSTIIGYEEVGREVYIFHAPKRTVHS